LERQDQWSGRRSPRRPRDPAQPARDACTCRRIDLRRSHVAGFGAGVGPAPRHGLAVAEADLDPGERRVLAHATPAVQLPGQLEHDSGSGNDVLRRTRKEAVMSSTTETTQRERVRVYATGSCEGFDKLRESLTSHPEIEMVGTSTSVADGAAALAGGHLDAILHATRGASLPGDELAAIREHSRAPILMLASGGSSGLL